MSGPAAATTPNGSTACCEQPPPLNTHTFGDSQLSAVHNRLASSYPNCNHHVAHCLNVMKYKGWSHWGMLSLWVWVFFGAR